MARGIPAIVTPEVLQWARDLDRITIDEIAQKLNVDAAKVSAWENGNEHPSLTQAKKLAKQYRVPFAFFYLPDVPKGQSGSKKPIIEHLETGDFRKCLVS